jgi:hypothetical protein
MKRVKIPFMHDMDGSQKPSQPLMQKNCEIHTFDFLFLSSVSHSWRELWGSSGQLEMGKASSKGPGTRVCVLDSSGSGIVLA